MFPIKLLKISGHSMQPSIRDGSLVLVNRWAYSYKKPQIGDVVAFRHENSFWCKRIAGVENETYRVQGDNPADSQEIPAIIARQIIGKVMGYKYSRCQNYTNQFSPGPTRLFSRS